MRKHRGMTLIEALIALSVFAISGSAVIYSVMNAMNGIMGLEESFKSELVAKNVLTELKLEHKWPSPSWVTNKTEQAGRVWYYRYRGQLTQDADFRAIEVEVFADSHVTTSTPAAILKTYVSR